jgi:dihydrolipoamide dehydrogenase
VDYDLIVIGAGPAGYLAALKGSKLGFKTACIDKVKEPGGTCLNIGCIPSKALLEVTEAYAHIKTEGKELGIEESDLSVSFSGMMGHKQKVVKSLNNSISSQFASMKVDYIVGTATVTAPNEVKVGDKRYSTKYILLATGSEPIALPFLPFDEKKVISSTGALALTKLPKKMVVVGAGAIGLELGSVYARLGTEVEFVEMLDQIGGNLDKMIQRHYLKALEAQGMKFHLGAKVTAAKVSDHVVLNTTAGDLKADCVLVSVGRRPYSQELGLDKVGIAKTEKGFVAVNDSYQTSVPSIYAVGDLIEGPMLAHRASEEGVTCVKMLKGAGHPIDYLLIPNIIYTYPEIASVGFTEEEARATGRSMAIGTSMLKSNGRALAAGKAQGIVKVIGDKESGRLLGMHLFMPHASELISLGVESLRARARVEDLAGMPFGHPTLSEAIKEACTAYL